MRWRFATMRTRRSRSQMFSKIDVLQNFIEFSEKHMCQSPFFNNVVGWRPASLFLKKIRHMCFPVNFAKFLKAPFWQNSSVRLQWWKPTAIALAGNKASLSSFGQLFLQQQIIFNSSTLSFKLFLTVSGNHACKDHSQFSLCYIGIWTVPRLYLFESLKGR